MAVHRDHRLVDIGHAVEQHLDPRGELGRNGVTHRIGNVDGSSTCLDRGLDAAAEKIVLGARAVLAAPLDIIGVFARVGHAVDHRAIDLLGLHLELELHVERAGRDEGVDALLLRGLERLGAAIDVALGGTRQAAHDRFGDLACNQAHGLEIAVRGDREAGFDDIHPHAFEHLGDPQFLVEIHRGARRLLAITQGGVKNSDTAGFLRVHDLILWTHSVDDVALARLPQANDAATRRYRLGAAKEEARQAQGRTDARARDRPAKGRASCRRHHCDPHRHHSARISKDVGTLTLIVSGTPG